MKSTERVGYDQNTKEYYYIPDSSHNDDYSYNDDYGEWNGSYNSECNNNSCDDSCEDSCDEWYEDDRESNSSDNQNNDENLGNNENSQTNRDQNSQNVNTRCGIQAWIKNAQVATPSGERIVFNIIRKHQDNEFRIHYDQDTNEFVFSQEGVYMVQWSINVTPSSGLGTVYLTFTLNDDDNSEVLSRVYTAYQGINGTPNIINRSSVIISANKNERYSLNNASDGLINIGCLNSSIGGNLSILRIS